ncbi:MAG: segregation/condensation protein A [Nocardioidaceae bacterium]|nr:segregation/condensation protein A [Nocardioidaceae bacterium]
MNLTLGEVGSAEAGGGFAVHLENFEGPFDLLVQLISKHKLDITEVALSRVTDEFIAHIKTLGAENELEQTTSFLVVAATLLDLKVVRLLPSADVEDEDDLTLLEARDLLLARLLQYRAFKQVAAMIERQMTDESRQVARSVGLEERFAKMLPEVSIPLGLEEFAALAALTLEPRQEPTLGVAHLHAPQVSVREQAAAIVERLRRSRITSFRALVAGSPNTATTVARFLALLELFREGVVAFDQVTPLSELSIRWTGSDEGAVDVVDEYDDPVAEAAEVLAEEVTEDDVRRIGQATDSHSPATRRADTKETT